MGTTQLAQLVRYSISQFTLPFIPGEHPPNPYSLPHFSDVSILIFCPCGGAQFLVAILISVPFPFRPPAGKKITTINYHCQKHCAQSCASSESFRRVGVTITGTDGSGGGRKSEHGMALTFTTPSFVLPRQVGKKSIPRHWHVEMINDVTWLADGNGFGYKIDATCYANTHEHAERSKRRTRGTWLAWGMDGRQKRFYMLRVLYIYAASKYIVHEAAEVGDWKSLTSCNCYFCFFVFQQQHWLCLKVRYRAYVS